MSAVSEGQTTSTSNNLQRSRPDTGKQTKRKSSAKQDNWRPLMMAANSNRMTTKAGASTSTSAEAATAAKLPQASPSSASSSSSGCSSPPNSSQKRTTTASSNNNKGNNLNNPNLLSPNSNEQQPSTHLAAPSAGQYRRKSTLSGNGFFIDYSCTRRRSSAAIQAARLAEQRDSIITRNQFLRTCMSPGAAAGRQRRPSSMVTGSSSHTAVAGNQQPAPNRHRSFCAGGPTAATSNSAGNSPARTNSRSSYSAGTTSHLLPAANLLHVPAAISLAGSRKTSIFDPVGHSLAAGAAHLRRKSTMTSTGLTPAVEQAATMVTVARNAAALTRGGQPKARCELVQRVPVIGCSPTSIRASLAALDETRRYEKLLRKLKKHQKHKLKRRQQLEGRHGRDFLSGSDPDHSNSQSDCDRGSSSGGSWSLSPSEGSPLRSRGHNQPGGANNNNNLRRKSIRAVKEMATLVNKAASEHLKSKRRAHRRARGQDPFVDGLSISSTLSFASSHTSLPSIDRFLDQYERALYEASSDSCQENDYEFEQEDDDDDELFVIVNDHNDNEHTGDTGGGAGEQTSQAKRLERPGTKRASIVRKAMRKLASTITRGAMGATSSQSQHQLGQTSCKQQDEQVAIMHQQRQPSAEAATDDAHANSKIGCQTRAEAAKQQQQRATSSSFRQNHQRPRRRSVSMSGGLNYWHYYYYLRANSLEAVDDLPVQVGPIGGGDLHASNGSTSLAGGCGGSVMSESERRARLYINYSLARLDILNSNSDPVARLADKLASIQQCQVESSCWSIGPNNTNTNTHTTTNNNATNTPNEQFVQSGGANQTTPASQWRQLFDFSQSTDVSLTLSTSSTSLQQSSTSRNSSSLSSPVSTVSSPGPHLDSSAHSWNGSAGSSASLAPSAAHHLARPTSSTPTGHNVYHHHQAGHLATSAPRPAHSVSSQSVRSVGQNQYLQGQQQHHLASSSQHYLSVAAPSTSSNKWPQQDHQMHAYLHGQQPFGGSRGQSGELELRYSHGNLLLDSPASRQIDHDQQHDERRRASTKISGKTNNNNNNGGGGNLSGQPDVDHVYEQISGEHVAGGGGGGGGLGGVGLSASSAAAAAAATTTSATKQATNEEELDDFERFNRCYKPLARQSEEQRAARQLEQAAPTRMGRDSHFRLSVKSLRAPSGRSPAKVVGSGEGRAGLGAGLAAAGGGDGGQSEPRQGPRAFLSWDTLTSPTLVADTRPTRAQDVGHLQWPTTTTKTTTPPGAPQQQQQRQQLSSPIGSVMQKDEDLSNLGRRRREAASRRSFRQPRSTCWSSAVGPGRLSASSYHQAANGAASAPTNTSPLNRRTRDEHNNDQQRQRDEDDDNNNNKQCWKTTETTTSGSANSNKDDHQQQERKGSSSLQLQFEAQMSEAANLAARAAVADLDAPLDIKTNNAEAKVGRREASKGDTSASYYHESAGGYCDLCDQAVGARCSSSGFLLFPSSSSALDRSAGLDDEPDNNARRQQHHLGPSGRARSQSNIVNLVSSLSSSSSAQPAPLPSADRTNHLGLSGAAMGARLGLPQPDNPLGRRCTSASLRVPKWRQQRDCEQADINSELKQQQQLHPAGPRQQPLNATATAVATSSSSCNSLSAGGPKMAATTSRNHISALGHPHHDDYDVHSSDRDQPRARAHSTGAGGATATGDHLSPRLVAAHVVREAHSELPARPANTTQQMSTIASSETHLNLVISSTTTTNHKQHKSSSHLLEREQRNLCLLRKNSFNCMVVGARQTGKRTIVKCFVKLLNEFKLAADEYKKEKMLSKLMECSERLNELQSQQEAAAAADNQEAQERHRRRSRLNSWLPGTNTVNKLLHFSPKNKQRLHSVVGIWAPQSDQENATSGHKPAEQQQRRHTTFGPHNSTEMTTVLPTTSGSSRFLNVDNAPTRPTIQTCATNKSDSELNNQQTTSFTVHQLKVPALHQTPALRKHSDTTGHSSGGHFLSADEDASKQTSNNGARRNTDAAAFSWRGSGEPIEGESPSRGQGGGTNANAPLKPTNLTSAKRRMSSKAPQRKHSIVGLSRRRRRMLLSLKELNGRRCGIKFKTRRQISESCLEQLKRPVLEDIKRRASIMATNKNSLLQDEAWPDSFLVVYSINDRDSFEYAKTLIGQLRANKQDVPLPIILVANKIDLERVRMVKREEGRTLARKNTCKFIELSCTVGFNLDNLLVGLRTQLILRHHIILNSILRGKSPRVLYKAREIQRKDDTNESGSRTQQQQPHKGSDNILIRFYKRYVMDNSEQDYDCDNFSKL